MDCGASDRVRENCGGARMRLSGIRIRQKGTELVVVGMTVAQLRRVVYVFRKSKDSPDALERQLIRRKVEDIRRRAAEDGTYFPNAIIVNIVATDKVRVTNRGNDMEVTVELEVPNHSADPALEDRAGKLGYIIDGQHRVEGLRSFPDFQLPVVLFLGLDNDTAFRTFADINEKQEKVSRILLEYIKWELRDYPSSSSRPLAFSMVLRLNNDDDSPLKDRIRVFEDERRKWVTSPTLTKLVEEVISAAGPMQHLKIGEQLKVLKQYLKAWKELFPEAWDDATRKEYVLTKAMGITIMFKLFPRFFRRCAFYQGGRYDKQAFLRELQPLKGMELPLGDRRVPLDWRSGIFGRMSSGKGISNLVELILLKVPERDTPS